MTLLLQVQGKRVTAFTDGEEDAVGYKSILPVHAGLGATCNEASSSPCLCCDTSVWRAIYELLHRKKHLKHQTHTPLTFVSTLV